MRKKITLSVFILLIAYPMLHGQTLAEKTITLSNTTSTVGKVLSDISSKGGFVFSYSNKIGTDRKVTVEGGTKTVTGWLDTIFERGKVEYVILENRIILRSSGKTVAAQTSMFTIRGHVRDSLSGEVLIGATVFIKGTSTGVSSNAYGFFSLTLPQGSYTIGISFMGYHTRSQEIDLEENHELEIKLPRASIELQEVSVTASDADDVNVMASGMGTHKLSAGDIARIPALAGEVDVFRALQLLPGVKNSGEVSSNISVRGGALDQNMILLDEAPIYNPSHAIGIFSVFNTDAINDVQLYKGMIPAEYFLLFWMCE